MPKLKIKKRTSKLSNKNIERIALKVSNLISGMLAYWDTNQICLFANEAYQGWFGKSQDEMIGISTKEFLGPAYDKYLPYIREALNGKTQTFEREIPFPNGKIRHCLVTYTPDIENGKVLGFVVHVAEVTDLKNLERDLKTEKDRLAAFIDNSTAVIFMKDLTGRYLLINRKYETLFHISKMEIIGKTDYDVFPVEIAEKFRNNDLQVIKSKSPVEFDETAPHDDGLHYYLTIKFPLLDNNGAVHTVCGIATDITDLRNREEDQMKIEKLESLGLLAGGIAHDFNNILTAIMGNVSLAKSFTDSKDQLLERLNDAERATLRASELSQQLLTFSKGGAPIKKIVSIQSIIEHSVHFALTGSNVKTHLNFQDPLWPVEADESQISQVIHNLVINAQQAMPLGGAIWIEAENLFIDVNIGQNLGVRQGNYLAISIRDQGKGIPKEHLSKIFDPYFTTKAKGSGLGLSISHSIIKRHQGVITAETNPELGSTFRIYLPALPQASAPEIEMESEQMTRGKGRVLVMDDEEDVLNIAKEIFIHLGYDVDLAKDGSEAVQRYKTAKESGYPFDVVITDLTVPGDVGGVETLKRLRAIDPGIKIIVSSGYANDPAMGDFKSFGFSDCLKKPYRAFEVSQTVKRVLKAR
ncbi:MAG: PAS domain-containing protein [Nitrospiria bacterium]